MRLIELAGFCPDTLRPLSPAQLARREQIADEMERVAKASEAYLPPDEQRGIFDLAELRAASIECLVACAVAAPVAFGLIVYLSLP